MCLQSIIIITVYYSSAENVYLCWLTCQSNVWKTNYCHTSPHYDDVTMGAKTSQITNLTVVYSTFYSGADQSKHQSSASLAFVWGIHRGPMNSPHNWPVTRKMLPFDDVIMDVIAVGNLPTATQQMVHFNSSPPPGAAYTRQWIGSALVQIMACRLFGAKPLSEPMLSYRQLDP